MCENGVCERAVCESGGHSVRSVVIPQYLTGKQQVSPEWGAAPIREDGSQKGQPMGAFPMLQPQEKGQEKK